MANSINQNGVATTTYYASANVVGFPRVLMEMNNTLVSQRNYIYGGGMQLAEENAAGQLAYQYHNGTVGSVMGVTDETGVVTQRSSYDEFGTRTTQIGTSRQYGYTGEEFDNETGLLYLRARYYDPSLGRFISNDPYWGRLEEPVTQNRYIYVQNSPLMYADPSGLDASTGIQASISYGIGETQLQFDVWNGIFALNQTTYFAGGEVGASAGGFYGNSVPSEGNSVVITGSSLVAPGLVLGIQKQIPLSGDIQRYIAGDVNSSDLYSGSTFNFGSGSKGGGAVGIQSTSILMSPTQIDTADSISGRINKFISNCVNGN